MLGRRRGCGENAAHQRNNRPQGLKPGLIPHALRGPWKGRSSTVVHAYGGACIRWCAACGACACSFSATAEDLPVPFELSGRRRTLLLSGIPSISQECAIVLRRTDCDSLGWLMSVVDQL